ncbi:flavin reductase [Pseudooceanicola sp. C21-150M6]|uniref:flavin reductase n=1 Tax=Pseudooceanicola sp. C21-150M6 TaxID=3434355 RepID=UPI003D7F204E
MTDDLPDAISKQEFRSTMGLFAGAVTLITTGTGAGRRGLTATAVCALTDTPPSLLVCVNLSSATHQAMVENGRFSVQLLSDQDEDLALHFAGATGAEGADKFSAGDWGECRGAQPRLKSALASVSCVVDGQNTVGSHSVFIGRIVEVCLSPDRESLVYARSRFHGLRAGR